MNIKALLTDKNTSKVMGDLCFFTLGFWFFFKSFILCVIAFLTIVGLIIFTKLYDASKEEKDFFEFVDFLNVLYSNLSVGMTLSHAVMEMDENKTTPRLIDFLVEIKKSVTYGNDTESFYTAITTRFHIEEAQLMVQMLKQSQITGASRSIIVGAILEQLRVKNKIKREIKSILFQKQLEQKILSIAPVGIIAFMNSIQPDYLQPLYTSLMGRGIMLMSFTIVVVMKVISEHLVQIKSDT